MAAAAPAMAQDVAVGILVPGSQTDRGFMQSAYGGAKKVEQTFGAKGKVQLIENINYADMEQAVTQLAAGDEPRAVDKSGASVPGVRWLAVLVTGVAAGLGGAGYLALAAVIFGRWRVIGTVIACLVFGLASSLQFQLPALASISCRRPS